jgi:hypothetical protein
MEAFGGLRSPAQSNKKVLPHPSFVRIGMGEMDEGYRGGMLLSSFVFRDFRNGLRCRHINGDRASRQPAASAAT